MNTEHNWKKRISDLWWDIRHPIETIEREIALRYCWRTGQVMVERSKVDWFRSVGVKF